MQHVDSFSASQSDDGRYRLLIDAITDYAIYMLDPLGRVTSWNPGAQRFKGYQRDEILGEHFSRFYTPEDQLADVPGTALRTAAEEGRYETEGWRVRKDGARFWAHVLIDPIRAPTGELVGFAKITRDLTERKLAEESLRRSEQEFRLLVQGVTDYAIYMIDPDGRVSNWNAGAQRIKGYTPAEIVGEHFSRFYTDEDRDAGEPARALRTAALEGRYEKEGVRVRKTGERFWAHVIIDPIRNDIGEIIGFAKVTRDITERREAQQALDAAREALFQSQKLDAIGQLTGGVAHDFNNLLMAVLGSLELLKKRLPEDDARAAALLDNAVQGAQRGAALTQRMLAFARRQDLKLEGVDVEALVKGVMGLLERSLGPTIRIETRFGPSLPPAHTDSNQLETALLNLAVNARDSMDAVGDVVIEATAHTVAAGADTRLPPGDYVRLSVTDSGPGMDAGTLERATEPFYTTKGVGKGTGLGLSMVHGLAEQSGGRLMISSRPGHGARVDIWLPRAERVSVDPQKEPASQGTPADARAIAVLVVDDDTLVLNNIAAMLEDLGHHTFTAASASEAMRLLERTSVDVVITDHAMPDMTGLELANRLKALRAELPVILATGFAELRPGEAGDLPRLAKPFTQDELAQALRDACPVPAPAPSDLTARTA